jgi:hypothetical protein
MTKLAGGLRDTATSDGRTAIEIAALTQDVFDPLDRASSTVRVALAV